MMLKIPAHYAAGNGLMYIFSSLSPSSVTTNITIRKRKTIWFRIKILKICINLKNSIHFLNPRIIFNPAAGSE